MKVPRYDKVKGAVSVPLTDVYKLIADQPHDTCHMSMQSAFGGRGDRADPSVWPEVEGPLEVISCLVDEDQFEKCK